jgi:hypothetical protein
MGFAASSARLFMLTARKSDLELQLQFIQQARMRLANVMNQLFPITGSLDPNDPNIQAKDAQLRVVQQQEKMLEVNANRVTMQHQAVETEIQAVNKVISNNIQRSFKLMG